MDVFYILFIGLIALVVIAAIVLSSSSGGEERGLPQILQNAKIFANEEIFSMTVPINLSGKPDQVWESERGPLVIVDTKNRTSSNIFESDRVQLSLYAFLLSQSFRGRHKDIYGTAYVRLPGSFGSRYVPVKLIPPEELIAKHARYWSLKDGRAAPKTNGAGGLCHHCGHRKKCAKFA